MPRSELRRSAVRPDTVHSTNAPQIDDNEDELVIDLGEIWRNVKKHLLLLLILIVAGAGIGWSVSYFLITPTYESTGAIFLTPKIGTEGVVDVNSLNSNQRLVTNVMNLITSDNIMIPVAEELAEDYKKEDYDADDIKEFIHVDNPDATEVISVSATTPSPTLSKTIVDRTMNIFIETMRDNLSVRNIEVVDYPVVNYKPVEPKVTRNTVIGALLGLVAGGLYIFFVTVNNKHLQNREQAEAYLGLPVYAELPILPDTGDKKPQNSRPKK